MLLTPANTDLLDVHRRPRRIPGCRMSHPYAVSPCAADSTSRSPTPLWIHFNVNRRPRRISIRPMIPTHTPAAMPRLRPDHITHRTPHRIALPYTGIPSRTRPPRGSPPIRRIQFLSARSAPPGRAAHRPQCGSTSHTPASRRVPGRRVVPPPIRLAPGSVGRPAPPGRAAHRSQCGSTSTHRRPRRIPGCRVVPPPIRLAQARRPGQHRQGAPLTAPNAGPPPHTPASPSRTRPPRGSPPIRRIQFPVGQASTASTPARRTPGRITSTYTGVPVACPAAAWFHPYASLRLPSARPAPPGPAPLDAPKPDPPPHTPASPSRTRPPRGYPTHTPSSRLPSARPAPPGPRRSTHPKPDPPPHTPASPSRTRPPRGSPTHTPHSSSLSARLKSPPPGCSAAPGLPPEPRPRSSPARPGYTARCRHATPPGPHPPPTPPPAQSGNTAPPVDRLLLDTPAHPRTHHQGRLAGRPGRPRKSRCWVNRLLRIVLPIPKNKKRRQQHPCRRQRQIIRHPKFQISPSRAPF